MNTWDHFIIPTSFFGHFIAIPNCRIAEKCHIFHFYEIPRVNNMKYSFILFAILIATVCASKKLRLHFIIECTSLQAKCQSFSKGTTVSNL